MSSDKDEDLAQFRRKRRSWTTNEKRRIVDESCDVGTSIAEIARRHDLNANQLFTWRRQFGVESVEPKELAPILPVTIAPVTGAEDPEPGSSGRMEIMLAAGDRMIVWADVDAVALTQVLKALGRR